MTPLRRAAPACCALLLACAGNNDPPELLSINGLPVRTLFGQQLVLESVYFVPGEALPIELEIDDPNGDAVRVWWPEAPVGWSFDPDRTTGVWYVPPHFPDDRPFGLAVVLEDDAPTPEARSVFIGFESL